jgi:hypothetical protein
MTVVEQPSRALDSPRSSYSFLVVREFSNINSLQFRKKIKETVFPQKSIAKSVQQW